MIYHFGIVKVAGEMLINPAVDAEDDIAWICDGCGAMLNTQSGFADHAGEWKCTECGFVNKIDSSEMYLSEDEYQTSLMDSYKGMTDEEVLELSVYEDVRPIHGREDVFLIRNQEENKLYVRKILKEFDSSIYRFLLDNPIHHMPRLAGVYEGNHALVIIEEYVEGKTLEDILQDGPLNQLTAIRITKDVCKILSTLHKLSCHVKSRNKDLNAVRNEVERTYALHFF